MGGISVSKAKSGNLEVLVAISRETFFEAFSADNTTENMNSYMEANLTAETLAVEMANPESLFYLAHDGDEVIGYLKLNIGKAQTEPLGDTRIEIERIYVKSQYHGKKVGQLLYEKALEVAKERHKTEIWLGVWEHNPKAIRFYEKNGFTPFDTHTFILGNEVQTDILMKKPL